MRPKSLTSRLILTSGSWVLVTLVATGLILTLLFRGYIERHFDVLLGDHLEELIAASEVDQAGRLQLTWDPADPRFRQPYSGWYWQIFQRANVVASAQSLWRDRLDLTQPVPKSRQTRHLIGPEDTPLRAIAQRITLPGATEPFSYVVAAPVAEIDADVATFVTQLAITLSVLGVGLVAAIFFQVRFGLQPLRGLRQALRDVRAGRRDRLAGSFPEEVQPVVSELNAVLDHNAALLERARTHTGNLAHALKNPLTVINNEASRVPGKQGEILRDQAAAMNVAIDRHLSRARAAGGRAGSGARTMLSDVVEDLRFSLEVLYERRGVRIRTEGLDGLRFRGDAQDLEEMLGNLMDNACKWARGEVLVSAGIEQEKLAIRIEDDGPGIPEHRRAEIFERGKRLDESAPGSGLGLDIVCDIAGLYHGSVDLDASTLGGLGVTLSLPAIAEPNPRSDYP